MTNAKKMNLMGLLAAAIMSALAAGSYADLAGDILEFSGIKGGLVVCVGCDAPEFPARLRLSSSFLVQALDADADRVAETRKAILAKGIYGAVSADTFDGKSLPYTDDIVSLLVVRDKKNRVSGQEIARVLSPRGVAVFKGGLAARPANLESQPGLEGWSFYRKRIPPGIDSWAHYLHGPDGNVVADDSVVGPPTGLRWTARPFWAREHRYGSKFTMVSEGGRIFYLDNDVESGIALLPDRPYLVARDAFSGVLLWKLPVKPQSPTDHMKLPGDADAFLLHEPDFPMELKLVATKTQLFAAFGRKGEVLVLDAATGELLKTVPGSEMTEEILVSGDRLITVADKSRPDRWRYSVRDLNDLVRAKRRGVLVRAFNATTGAKLWEYDSSEHGGLALSPVLKEERLFMLVGMRLVGANLPTGDLSWGIDIEKEDFTSTIYSKGPAVFDHLIACENVVLLVYSSKAGRSDTHITAFSADKGEELWTYQGPSAERSGTNVYVVDERVWVHGRGTYKSLLALNLRTGEVEETVNMDKVFEVGHHHRCYGNRATSRFLLTARRGVEFTGFDSGEVKLHHWLRGKCRFGVLPCNGLLYTLPHACSCYPFSTLKGYSALASSRDAQESSALPSDQDRLEKGPAFGTIPRSTRPVPRSKTWPMHRHDPERSGSTSAAVRAHGLEIAWEKSLGGTLTAATVLGERLYVANLEKHAVYSLSVKDGKTLWMFSAGGRVDSPPTLHQGLALFGSADGWVYCVRADTGEMVWRFLAAPSVRRIVSDESLESVWPVHGSVLVQNGIAYVSAGRTSLLDGGLALYALDPATGRLLASHRISRPYSEAEPFQLDNKGHNYDGDIGVLQDLLVGDGKNLSLRQLKMDANFEALGKSTSVISGNGLLNPAWFSRIGWYFGQPTVESRKSNFNAEKPLELIRKSAAQGQYLVFDDKAVYSVRIHPHIGKFDRYFAPGGAGYRIFADERIPDAPRFVSVKSATAIERIDEKDVGRSLWNIHTPLRAEAMLVAGDKLFLAGAPDLADKNDPWGAIDGTRGGLLWGVCAASGEKIAELKLPAPPVFDGMSSAGGMLFASLKDGRIICCRSKKSVTY